jgi:acetyltransferase-like isoleucine patch superfamily enzyme
VTSLRRRAVALARSDAAFWRVARRTLFGVLHFSLPMPKPLADAYRGTFVLVRGTLYWFRRVLVAEPIFRGYASRVGRNFHTGVYVHWITGDGRIVVGDDTRIDGKCNIMFSWSSQGEPELVIGDRTHVGHECSFTIAESIRIGSDCLFGSGVRLMDCSAHPIDPTRRLRGERPTSSEIRPIVVGDNVWIGAGAVILPGVHIGDGSVIGAGAVVTRSVPADSIAAGVPARVVRSAREDESMPMRVSGDHAPHDRNVGSADASA